MLPFKRRKQRDLLDALTAPPQQSSRLATRSSDMFDSSSSCEAPGLQFRHASAGHAAISTLVPDEVRLWEHVLMTALPPEHRLCLQCCHCHLALRHWSGNPHD